MNINWNTKIESHKFRFIAFGLSITIPFIILCSLFLPLRLESQNLLPDGGFEILIDETCKSPIQAIQKLKFWYLLDATPDLFQGGCSFEASDFVFWDDQITPYEGRNYAGIWSRWNSNDTYFSEGLATSLLEPLEAGKTYYFEMAIKNQGSFQGLDGSITGCTLEPEKHIDLYLSTDSIRVINDFATGSASTTSNLVATLDSEDISGGGTEDWTIVSTCFEASGGEQFFALIMPLGTFGELPPCTATMASSGVFRSFYFAIDGAFLTELPDKLEQQITECSNRPYEVNLTELFDFVLLDQAGFEWEDGSVGAERRLDETGDFSIDAQLSCGVIPLELNVLGEDCTEHYFIPNIFSPNGDGKNDEFKVAISSQTEVFNFEFAIYDRWGSLIFQSFNPEVGWNGCYQNRQLAQGTYTWRMRFETRELDLTKEINERGAVLLMH